MKLILSSMLLASLLGSCMSSRFYAESSSEIPVFKETKTFAFMNGSDVNSSLRQSLGMELKRRNYAFDAENPDYLVTVQIRNEKNETKKTIEIQLIQNKDYRTIWRGYSSGIPLKDQNLSYYAYSALNF